MAPKSGVPVRATFLAVLALAVLAPVQGGYRFGTLNWKLVKEPGVAANTVDFELVTAWRRDFNWVYVSQQDPPPGQPARTLEDRPIVGDKLRVTGLSFADDTGLQAVEAGTSEILFYTGDGKTYFVDVDVTAFSASENWIMGVTNIRHTYARPFYGKDQNIYPVGYSYDAATGAALDANQPFTHTPWTAYFSGCCRWSESLEGNKNRPYKVVTNIDMTDRDNSPAARTMPTIVVPQAKSTTGADQPIFYVMARDQYTLGSDPAIAMSGGTDNYPNDDNISASLTYKIATADDLMLDQSKYTPFSAVTVVDATTGKLSIRTNSTVGSGFAVLPVGFYQVAVRVDACSARSQFRAICRGGTVIDFMVRVVSFGANNNGRMPVPVGPNTEGALTGDSVALETKFGWVGFPMSAHVRLDNLRLNKLVLNYVFAGLAVKGSSAETMQAVQYSNTDMSHQGLPAGAKLFATANDAVVEVQISFDNPFSAHRPGHDAALNKDKLDYAFAPNAKALWEKGFRPILKPRFGMDRINPAALDATLSLAAFDMNVGTGGAAVYLWARRSATEPAVTELAISHCEMEEAMGFVALPQNVNEQSTSTSVVKVWYKKGTGAAITGIMLVDQAVDTQWCNSSQVTIEVCVPPGQQSPNNLAFQSRPFAKCGDMTLIKGNLNFANLQLQPQVDGRGVFMYVQNAPESQLRRVLEWTPQQAGHYIFCYAGAEAGMPQFSSTQRCISFDVKPDPAPKFDELADLSTFMGKILRFTVSYTDINHIDEKVSITELLRFSNNDIAALQQAGKLIGWSTNTAAALQLAGAKFVGEATRVVLDERRIKTSRNVEWFPDATYGGFKGDICYTGVDSALCSDATGFEDIQGRSCKDYESSGLCKDGKFVSQVFTLAQMANAQGGHAGGACCACGGGVSFRAAQTSSGCVNIAVERCQWYVQTEDSLIQVAARFATNWLQIWHFNPTLMHPDSALPPETLINIGHLYEVEPNDAMAVLAERFGTSTQGIRMNNWDLAQLSDAMLPLAKSICIIPNSCVTAANVRRDVAI